MFSLGEPCKSSFVLMDLYFYAISLLVLLWRQNISKMIENYILLNNAAIIEKCLLKWQLQEILKHFAYHERRLRKITVIRCCISFKQVILSNAVQ